MWEKLLGDWLGKLKSVSIKKQYLNSLLPYLDTKYAFYDVYPKKKLVFDAFKKTQFKDLKVVIIGQSPFTDGTATGLAFGNEEKLGTKINPSLALIEDCITNNVKDGLYFMDYSLERWAKQGVLLINAALTVEKGKPNSHTQYWEYFTQKVIQSINEYHSGVIFCFWGDYLCKKYKPMIGNNHYVLNYMSPAAAFRKGIDWNCPHFNDINRILENNNGKEFKIDW